MSRNGQHGQSQPSLPLSGFLVIDVSQGIAGGYCTRLLAGYGAEVIKVEPPAGEETRSLPPFPADLPDPEASGTFLVLNMAKKSITLDWRTATGRELLLRLIAHADVLVESGGAEDLAWLGLDEESLARERASLIVTSITPFGLFGPYRDYQMTEAVVAGAGGLMSLTGEPDREPLRNGANLAAMGAGQNAYVATVAALFSRLRGGGGDHIDIAVFDHIATIPEVYVQMTVNDGEPRRRLGNRTGATWGLFPAGEGFVGVACDYRRDIAHVGEAFDVPQLMSERYDDYIFGRAKYIDEIEALLRGALLSTTAEEAYHRAQEHHLPWGFVNGPADLLRSEQLRVRGFWAEVDHPVAGRLMYPSRPVAMSEAEWRAERAPLLGEHNEEILRGRLGLRGESLAELRAAGVV